MLGVLPEFRRGWGAEAELAVIIGGGGETRNFAKKALILEFFFGTFASKHDIGGRPLPPSNSASAGGYSQNRHVTENDAGLAQ